MKRTNIKILNPVVAVIFLLTTLSMVSADNDDRIQDCVSRSGEGAIYLKEFIVSLDKVESGQRPPMFRQAVILRGNNIYRFNLCNDKGKAVIRIYDSSKMLLSSYDSKTKKEYDPINFLCRKTGQYNIIITFQDGKAGEAVGIMSQVMK
ncbi:MAG: hypothetical protein GY790_23735 [Bacteroidetes bacterium]|nr:hypothetical protein [Bacteroidota bacterium]